MKVKLYIMGMLLGLFICGCNKTPDIPESDFGTATSGDVEKQEFTEILIPPNGEIHYSEAELQIVEDVLGNHENAHEIMNQLNGFGIYDVVRVELLVAGKKQELEVETADDRIFVIHYYTKNYHIYAVEKDDTYIYTEVY